MADIVKLSDEDLDWFGETGTADEIAARWLDLGPKLIDHDQGQQGRRRLHQASTRCRCRAEPVKVVDTVGAGDTFNAGVLASLHDQGALAKAGDRQPVGGRGRMPR